MQDLTAVITLHAEGKLALKSILSFQEAISNAKFYDIDVEPLYCLDRATSETIDTLKQSAIDKSHIRELSFGDQGNVRNYIAGIANGRYIAFLDGDDLWSANWLVEAYKTLESAGSKFIAHPEYNLFFGNSNNVLKIPSHESVVSSACLRAANPWDALCFCLTQTQREFPYAIRDIQSGFAYEDWYWSRTTYEAGFQHITVPDTIIFKRRRTGSQGEGASRRNVMAPPTTSVYYKHSKTASTL